MNERIRLEFYDFGTDKAHQMVDAARRWAAGAHGKGTRHGLRHGTVYRLCDVHVVVYWTRGHEVVVRELPPPPVEVDAPVVKCSDIDRVLAGVTP